MAITAHDIQIQTERRRNTISWAVSALALTAIGLALFLFAGSLLVISSSGSDALSPASSEFSNDGSDGTMPGQNSALYQSGYTVDRTSVK